MAEPAPAPCSTRISSPAAVSLPSASGTRATRRSPGAVSLATPTFIRASPPGVRDLWDPVSEEYLRRIAARRGGCRLRATGPERHNGRAVLSTSHLVRSLVDDWGLTDPVV